MRPSGPGLLFVGGFLITVMISVLVIGRVIFSIPVSVLEDCTFIRTCPLLPGCLFYCLIATHVVTFFSGFWLFQSVLFSLSGFVSFTNFCILLL